MMIRDIWRRITSGNSNESLEKTSVLRKPLKIGDYVVHTPSNSRGTITAVERIGRHDTLRIEGHNGLLILGVSRQEVRLANAERYLP